MRVAVPVASDLYMYQNNPCTAPMYVIYKIHPQQNNLLVMTLDTVIVNTSQKEAEALICSCSTEVEDELEHKIWHYTIVDTLKGCDYLLANSYCKNTKRSLDIAGIKLYNTPPFIKQTELAVKNFIIGEHIADNVQHIHYAS